jgi:hypothetical protein
VLNGKTGVTTALTSVSADIGGYNSAAFGSGTAECTAPIGGECQVEAEAWAGEFFSSFVHPEDLGLFIGGGTVDVAIRYDGRWSTVNIFVEYTYYPPTNPDPVAPVPIPAAGGLILAAVGGLALLRRRAGSADRPGRS